MSFFKFAIEKGEDVACVQDANLHYGRPTDLLKNGTYYGSIILTAQVIIQNHSLIHCFSAQYDHSVFVNFSFQNKITAIGSQYSPPSADLQVDLNDWENINTFSKFFHSFE